MIIENDNKSQVTMLFIRLKLLMFNMDLNARQILALFGWLQPQKFPNNSRLFFSTSACSRESLLEKHTMNQWEPPHPQEIDRRESGEKRDNIRKEPRRFAMRSINFGRPNLIRNLASEQEKESSSPISKAFRIPTIKFLEPSCEPKRC